MQLLGDNICALIGANMYFAQDPDLGLTLYWINVIFVSVYVFELISKMIALSFVFFEDLWYVAWACSF